ncbi:MAG: S8 family peptidase [Ignavibacteria bacterium]|nr:S8 family peptidase [Ignavibacteria bacterium]
MKLQFKFGFLLLTVLLISFSLFGFKDSGDYELINGEIIKRGHEKMYLKGHLVIKFKEQVNILDNNLFGVYSLDNILQRYDVHDVKQLHPISASASKRFIGDEELAKIFMVKYSSDIDPFELASDVLSANGNLLDWAEPSFVYTPDYVPNDPLIAGQWHINKIASFQAWDVTRGDTNIVIGIVDSGSDLDHPDLAANIKYNWLENPTNGIDDDANGYIDDWRGWDFYYNDNDPNIYYQDNDHGSHVSGCASQVTDNNVHGAGIGFKSKLLISKHTPDAGGSLYYTDQGITYCYQNGAKVINCSFGSSYYSSYSQTVVNTAWANGTVVVGSAGNENLNIPRYPASYDNVVSSAATNSSDLKASFSNYHSSVDCAAPGDNILSTVWNNSYIQYSGTSMSAPVTSGTIALIRASHPAWTPAQVVERLLLGVDSIYHLNPSYVGMLGTGRINAFKCVADKPILSLLSSMHTDSVYGNNDKVYDIGEVIPIAVTMRNIWLAGNNISIRLTTADTDIEIVQDSVFIGNLAFYQSFSTTYANTFRVKAKSTCPFDKDVVFKIDYSSSAYTINTANTLTIRFRSGFATHNINNLKLSLTNDGAVGKKTQAYGNGLFIGSGTNNNIFEGGLLVGLSDTKVSDVCRRGASPANVSDTDFVALNSYSIITPGTVSNQDGTGKFNDDGAGANKIGVEVNAFSYAFTSANDQNYILLRYGIKNTTSSALNNLYAGIYIYYSPNGISTDNMATLDTVNKLGIVHNNTTPTDYLGLAMMTNHNLNFRAVNVTSEVLNGWTTAEKYTALSTGISSPSYGPGRAGVVVSGGPFNLAPNQVEYVGFAVVYSGTLAGLKTNTQYAKTKYTSTIGIKNISTEIPAKYELSQNYPNPFNPNTTIKFAIPKQDLVKIKVFDVLGKEVSVLVNEQLDAGYYEVTFNAQNLSSGLYFYRIESSGLISTRKMLLVK